MRLPLSGEVFFASPNPTCLRDGLTFRVRLAAPKASRNLCSGLQDPFRAPSIPDQRRVHPGDQGFRKGLAGG